MKKIFVAVCISMLGTMLMAGGNVAYGMAEVAMVPVQSCEVNKIYIEADAKLMWQDQAYTDAEDGAYSREYSAGKAGKWRHAVNYCRTLDYAGYIDWRLPTSHELMAVHRKTGQLFTYHRGADFWTSTPTTGNKYYVVYPVDSYQYKRNPNESNYIRCVRCVSEKCDASGSRIIR